jgi:mono/diheme cytochrome c family protein
MTKGKLLLLVVVAALLGAGIYTRSLVRRGWSTRTPPSGLEIFLARTMRRMSIPASARDEQNPWKTTPDVIAAGRAHWADHCATCHGNDGSGNTIIGQNLYPRAPDMRQAATQNLTDGELYAIIENGVRLTGMPGWDNPAVARDDESWHLVIFIRHLPQITPEELQEMNALNPKTEAEREEEKEEQNFLNGGKPPQ